MLSALINWILIKYSVNLGVRNISRSEEIRWQKRKPSVGGLSFYLVFVILFAIVSNIALISSSEQMNFQINHNLCFLAVSTMGFFIGLIDDAKNTNPLLKLLGQISCGIVFVLFGLVIPIAPSFIWNSILTVLWTVFLMNSINMLDNMDGLTASISIIILMGCILHIGFDFSSLPALMAVVTIGALLGFIYYNWHPSRIYMGDSGSQFLGIILAYLSILFLWKNRSAEGGYFQINQFFAPFMIFTIPIFDTTTVTIHRLLRRQSPFVGGKDHLSHHLVFLGLKDWQSVCVLALINIAFVVIAIVFNQIQFYFPMLFIWFISFGILQFLYIKAKHKTL